MDDIDYIPDKPAFFELLLMFPSEVQQSLHSIEGVAAAMREDR